MMIMIIINKSGFNRVFLDEFLLAKGVYIVGVDPLRHLTYIWLVDIWYFETPKHILRLALEFKWPDLGRTSENVAGTY